MKYFSLIALFISTICLLTACDGEGPKEYTSVVRKVGPTVESQVMQHADWTHNAVGYRVDLYDQSTTADLNGLVEDLPRLKELGIDYLVLPPIFESKLITDTILHDFKAFTDFRKIDEAFGTDVDFQNLSVECHSRGIRILLTWPSGQVSSESVWAEDYPQLFNDSLARKIETRFWSGVVNTDFTNDTTLQLISDTWSYWLENFGVDGFYCTASELAPLTFWEKLRATIGADEKQFFMATDRSDPAFHGEAFDMTATPRLHETLLEVCSGNFPPEAIDLFIQQHERDFPLNAYRELYATNDVIRTRKGSLEDQFGRAHKLVGILMFTLPGMPVMFTGQEVSAEIEGPPFESDSIDFNNALYSEFYSQLIKAHHENRALWSGLKGGRYERLTTAEDQALFAFSRSKGENKVVVILNFSDQPADVDFEQSLDGTYQSIFNNEMLSIFTEGDVKLPPYGYQVFVK
ncbi:alpha-amylase family glycosyl hydrolase [Halocola ammonii]